VGGGGRGGRGGDRQKMCCLFGVEENCCGLERKVTNHQTSPGDIKAFHRRMIQHSNGPLGAIILPLSASPGGSEVGPSPAAAGATIFNDSTVRWHLVALCDDFF